MSGVIEPTQAQSQDVALVKRGDLAWTPEALKEKVERERALRSVVIEYFKSQLREGHHYYTLPGQGVNRKPALAKEGGLNLCSLFEVVPEPEQPNETFHKDGHYSVRLRVRLRSLRTGQIVATGDGSCSTRESKYAYRWLWEREVPKDLDKATLPTRRLKTKNGWTTQYRVANADLPDQYNTVLKMADKRASVAAALKLPLVSELFTQDLEEQIAEHEDDAAQPEAQGGEADSPSGAGPAPGSLPGPSTPRTEAPPAPGGSPDPVPYDYESDREPVMSRAQAMVRLTEALKKSGLATADLRKRSGEMFGKTSANELTDAELRALVDEIEGLIQATAQAAAS